MSKQLTLLLMPPHDHRFVIPSPLIEILGGGRPWIKYWLWISVDMSWSLSTCYVAVRLLHAHLCFKLGIRMIWLLCKEMGNDLQKEAESLDDSQQAGSGTSVDERSSTVSAPFSSCVDPPVQHEVENRGSTAEDGVTISRLTDEFESQDGKWSIFVSCILHVRQWNHAPKWLTKQAPHNWDNCCTYVCMCVCMYTVCSGMCSSHMCIDHYYSACIRKG